MPLLHAGIALSPEPLPNRRLICAVAFCIRCHSKQHDSSSCPESPLVELAGVIPHFGGEFTRALCHNTSEIPSQAEAHSTKRTWVIKQRQTQQLAYQQYAFLLLISGHTCSSPPFSLMLSQCREITSPISSHLFAVTGGVSRASAPVYFSSSHSKADDLSVGQHVVRVFLPRARPHER